MMAESTTSSGKSSLSSVQLARDSPAMRTQAIGKWQRKPLRSWWQPPSFILTHSHTTVWSSQQQRAGLRQQSTHPARVTSIGVGSQLLQQSQQLPSKEATCRSAPRRATATRCLATSPRSRVSPCPAPPSRPSRGVKLSPIYRTHARSSCTRSRRRHLCMHSTNSRPALPPYRAMGCSSASTSPRISMQASPTAWWFLRAR
mmetsp:Transcript_44653/g.96298  ORF Transcript_44653/g.96298 Transcript_44653/m.96298 type:complete len:201 (-) Transcript_44653:32-634(-)